MLIGHLGPACAARARWPDIPVSWLLVATMAPDLARLALAATPNATRLDLNLYTHYLPWSLLLAAAAALLAYMVRRDGRSALVVGAVVLSHVALDMISGRKPLWYGGPWGLEAQQYQQVEFVIEAGLLVAGWRLLRRVEPGALLARRSVLAALLVIEATYLTRSLLDRPYATRCIEYPLQPCWIRRHDRPPVPPPPREKARTTAPL
jgi:hypothetical protein